MGSQVRPRRCRFDGVPPSGVADQVAGIRRSAAVAPCDRALNYPQQGSSWTADSAKITSILVPEGAPHSLDLAVPGPAVGHCPEDASPHSADTRTGWT